MRIAEDKRVVLIGTGRVATQLAHKLMQLRGFRLVQLYGRRFEAISQLIQEVGEAIPYTTELKDISPTANYYIFALKDDALQEVWQQMPQTEGIWLHTAGSIALEAMLPYHREGGVLYPLQTFSLEQRIDWVQVSLYIEGTTATATQATRLLARTISPKVYEATSEQRKALHIGAVLACNFTNHLIALAQTWLKNNQLPPESLMPLIEATISKLHDMPAIVAQTGPASRGDIGIIKEHLTLLSSTPHLQSIYRLLSESIIRSRGVGLHHLLNP